MDRMIAIDLFSLPSTPRPPPPRKRDLKDANAPEILTTSGDILLHHVSS